MSRAHSENKQQPGYVQELAPSRACLNLSTIPQTHNKQLDKTQSTQWSPLRQPQQRPQQQHTNTSCSLNVIANQISNKHKFGIGRNEGTSNQLWKSKCNPSIHLVIYSEQLCSQHQLLLISSTPYMRSQSGGVSSPTHTAAILTFNHAPTLHCVSSQLQHHKINQAAGMVWAGWPSKGRVRHLAGTPRLHKRRLAHHVPP